MGTIDLVPIFYYAVIVDLVFRGKSVSRFDCCRFLLYADALRMGLLGWVLLVLVLFHCVFVKGSGSRLRDCGHAFWFPYLRSSADFELLHENGKAVDTIRSCKNLKIYSANGCFCGSELEEWKRVGRKYCGLELSAPHAKSVKCIRSSGKTLGTLCVMIPTTDKTPL